MQSTRLRTPFWNDLLGIFLGNGFLQGLRAVVDDLLGFLQAQAGQSTDDLDDSDLVRAAFLQDDVELGLLFSGLSSTGSGSSNSGSGSGDTEGLFKSMDKLRQLEDGQTLNFFDQGSDFLRHYKILLISVIDE